jgi:NDP-sugar pyrophosphorylase family protein
MGKIQHCLIMAAGRGQRMMPLTEKVPKPMAPHNGSTLIANQINKLSKFIPNIHVTVGYKGPVLAEHVIASNVTSVIHTAGQSNSWWIYNTLLSYVDEPVYIMTCDNIAELDFELLEKDYNEQSRPPCMLIGVKPVLGLSGDYIFHDNFKVYKLDRKEPAPTYCSGIQIINPFQVKKITKNAGDFYNVWGQLIEQNRLWVSSVLPDKWFSVDTVEHLQQLS